MLLLLINLLIYLLLVVLFKLLLMLIHLLLVLLLLLLEVLPSLRMNPFLQVKELNSTLCQLNGPPAKLVCSCSLTSCEPHRLTSG